MYNCCKSVQEKCKFDRQDHSLSVGEADRAYLIIYAA